MYMKSVEIHIEYRVISGPGEVPRDKRLRARVVTHSADGPVYGVDIFPTRCITRLNDAERLCVQRLAGKVKEIHFTYDPLLGFRSKVVAA